MALHDSRGRREQGLLLLEGTHLIQEVIRLQLEPHHLLATTAWLQAHPSLVALLPKGCQVQRVSPEVLQAVATTQHPDGVVATLAPPRCRHCLSVPLPRVSGWCWMPFRIPAISVP